MKNKTFKIRGKVWLYPADSGAWHFVNIPKKESAEIEDLFGPRYAKGFGEASKNHRGFGSIPVSVTIGKTSWKTSIFPSKEGIYLLPIKADVRKREGIFSGDTILFSIKL